MGTRYSMGRLTMGMGQSHKKKNFEPEMMAKVRMASDVATKRNIVAQVNPNHYIFGETLTPWKPWLTYTENMEKSNESK